MSNGRKITNRELDVLITERRDNTTIPNGLDEKIRKSRQISGLVRELSKTPKPTHSLNRDLIQYNITRNTTLFTRRRGVQKQI